MGGGVGRDGEQRREEGGEVLADHGAVRFAFSSFKFRCAEGVVKLHQLPGLYNPGSGGVITHGSRRWGGA